MQFIPQPPCVGGYDEWTTTSVIQNDLSKQVLSHNCKAMVYSQCFLTQSYIEEAIGDEYLKWNNETPVLLDAPTGSGKSTFVCEKLIRNAAAKGANLLLVSNRTALVRQQRMKVAKVVSEYNSFVNPNPKDSVIEEFKLWGNVCVCTYQGLFSLLEQAQYNHYYRRFLSNLMYAVFDEVHFLYADATFADSCGTLLRNIPALFFRTIRVYMTATSWSILESLKKSEQHVWYTLKEGSRLRIGANTQRLCQPKCPKREFLHYCMNRNYDRYNLHFFPTDVPCTSSAQTSVDRKQQDSVKASKKEKLSKELAILIDLFPQPSSTNKLLVFVRRREDGRDLEKAWRKKGVDAVFIDRTSKYDPEQEHHTPQSEKNEKSKADQKYRHQVWNNLLRDEKFNESVLIATSVLDCGINIHDEAVKTIVCFADEPTSFIQMLGRKRMSATSTDKVDVWVYVPSAGRFAQIAETKEQELYLAERLEYIRYFQQSWSCTVKGSQMPGISRKNGHIETSFRDDAVETFSRQFRNRLSCNYALKYDANYLELYYKLWSSYGRISDKRLFFFDSYGQPYVDPYVKWVVEEQKRYYRDLESVPDFKAVVSTWLGKGSAYEERSAAQMQKLIALLDECCKYPVPYEQRGELRSTIKETTLVCLSDNSYEADWSKMTPKTLNQILDALDLHYHIERAPGTRSKDWIVTRT